MQHNRILLFVKIPPPTTGATLMNKRVIDSELLNRSFNISAILISYMKSRREMGKIQWKKLLVFINIFIKLISVLVFKRIDLVYFQISPTGIAFIRDLVFVTLIKIFRVKIVYHLRGKGIKNSSQNRIKKTLYKFTFNGSDVICLSELLTYDIRDVFSGKIHIVPNGIPDINYKCLQNKQNKKEIKNLLFLSNLIIDKGVLDFIQAIEIINKKGYKINAWIVGSEADLTENQLKNEINNRKLNNCLTYLGEKYDQEKYDVLTNTDVLVFPTKLEHETFGNVNLEAMQFGIPVIATNVAAIPDIIDDGVNGYLVDKSAPNQIADKLEYLIKHPDLSKQMGNAGRKKYEEKYTLQIFEQNMKQVFEKCLRSKN